MNLFQQPKRPAHHSIPGVPAGRFRLWLIPTAVWLLLLLGCSSLGLVEQGAPVATPIPTRQPVPTFTPTPNELQPLIVITPPRGETPGVIILPPNVTPNLIFPPQPTPLPTVTLPPFTPTYTPIPTETPIPTPTLTPTPFVIVESGLVSMRTGPGVNYPLVAPLAPDIPVTIIGKNTLGDWLQICCVNGGNVWVAASHVRIVNDISQIALLSAEPAPTPTFTPTPTETPTATPYIFPFERAVGPQFFPTNNEFLTIWVYLYIGENPFDGIEDDAAGGYFLEVQFAGFDRPNTNRELPSYDYIEWSAPIGAGNRLPFNYKYEYQPFNPVRIEYPSATATPTPLQLLGTGSWSVWVKDGAGNALSEPVIFFTDPSNPNREVYIAWRRIR
ncbi:MAG: hypothetical protein DWI57_07005 [Chloroflexi bacterium]|nr:MAG: hypothetical protein DWI57_07005 [Chloroflexota bacterium]